MTALTGELLKIKKEIEKTIFKPIDELLGKETETLKNSFHAFVKACWHVIEGNKPFIDSWHIGAVCEHLEALHRLEIRKLIINVPPRSSKSTISTIMWPVWTWLHDPSLQYFCLSHSDDLATRHGVLSRDIITSPWFKSRWGDLFTIKQDQNNKHMYVNNKTGFRESCGILAKITGKGATRVIVDDANDAEEFESISIKVNEKYSGGLSTRVNNPNTSTWLLIQQRTREKDLTGHILANESDWVHLYLPMEFEEKRRCVTVPLPSTNGKPWRDPRKKEGELLWPDFFPEKEVEQRKRLLGSYRYAGQYQQRPAPAEGGLIKRQHFKLWKHPHFPKFKHVIQSWDLALSEQDTACYSACTTWGLYEDKNKFRNLMLISAWRGKVEYAHLRRVIKRLYNDYLAKIDMREIEKERSPFSTPVVADRRIPDVVLIEHKVSGIIAIQDLRRAGVNAFKFNPNKYGKKVERLKMVSHLIEAGHLTLQAKSPDYEDIKPEFYDFLNECLVFPNGEYDDYVDTMTQVLIRLFEGGYLQNSLDDTYEKDE